MISTTNYSSMMVMLILIFGAVLYGCHRSPMSTKSPIDASGQSYVLVSPQTISGFSLEPLPTPSSADVAIIKGRLMRDFGSHSEPMAGIKILLASVLRSEDGTPVMAKASEETSPMTVTNEDGVFVFMNVPPDTYGIAVVTPIGLFLIRDERGKDFLVTVQGGVVLDLGEVHTTLPY